MGSIRLGVTLHSFNVEYYTYKYALEDCLAAVGSLGPGQGVELVAPAMIRGFPDLPAEFEHRFRRAVEAHDLRPTAYGAYGDAERFTGRWASDEEQLDYLRRQIRAARRLGFPLIRVQPSEVVLSGLVGYAERHDVKMVIEIHAPMAIEDIESMIERVEAVDSPYLGFAPDCGMFCHTIADVAIERYRELGVPAAIIDAVVGGWHERVAPAELLAEVRALGGDHHAEQFVHESQLFWGHSEPMALRRIMPLIRHVHGKFYNVNADGQDSAVRFPEVIDELLRGGYDGPFSFEYDGHLWTRHRLAIDEIRTLHTTTLRQIHAAEARQG
jgi:sugar phosphate isomerase/epimerase